MKELINIIKHIRFIYFLAWWVITLLLCMYFFAILLPEKFANSPIVTQFTTMAGSVIMLVLGYFFGGMAEKRKAAETLNAPIESITVPEQTLEVSSTNNTEPLTDKPENNG